MIFEGLLQLSYSICVCIYMYRCMYIGAAMLTSPDWLPHLLDHISFYLQMWFLLYSVMNSTLSVHVRCTVRTPSGDLTFRTSNVWKQTETWSQRNTLKVLCTQDRGSFRYAWYALEKTFMSTASQMTSWDIFFLINPLLHSSELDLWEIFDNFNV